MCGVTLSDRDPEAVFDIHFGRVPQEKETVLIFGKLYKVAGVSWPVEKNVLRLRNEANGDVVATSYSAITPTIHLVVMWEEEDER